MRIQRLVKLSADWAPWTYQVESWVADGAAYGSPGRKICVGWINFETREAARSWIRRR